MAQSSAKMKKCDRRSSNKESFSSQPLEMKDPTAINSNISCRLRTQQYYLCHSHWSSHRSFIQQQLWHRNSRPGILGKTFFNIAWKSVWSNDWTLNHSLRDRSCRFDQGAQNIITLKILKYILSTGDNFSLFIHENKKLLANWICTSPWPWSIRTQL